MAARIDERKDLIGKRLQDVQAPAAVIDVAVVRRNCQLMLDTTKKLGIDFRAHVKTHKTVQLARLQVGEDSEDIRLLVSTVAELEHLSPWLQECRHNGKAVNVMYGLPVSIFAIPRLAQQASLLGPGTVSVIIDHPDQVKALDQSAQLWPGDLVSAYIKIDVGYHRAGIIQGSAQWIAVATALASAKAVQLAGFYAHMGQSYAVSGPEEALDSLVAELQGLHDGAEAFWSVVPGGKSALNTARQLVLTLGASPTATASQNVLGDDEASIAFRKQLEAIKRHFTVEIHAGVYPVLDMQQLATRARPEHASNDQSQALLSQVSLALRIMVEVASVYDDRNGEMEALVAAGSIVLGREPCKSYPGWGVVTPWLSTHSQTYNPDGDRTGWIIDRISQEHGVLRWHGARDHFSPMRYGQKLMLWPNHACMAGPNFEHYLVVDSAQADADEIVDVWTRCRGW